jgi:hypothetical protein
MVLAYVAVVRALTSGGLIVFTLTSAPAYAIIPLLTFGCSVGYLIWLVTRGRKRLREQPVAERPRRIVIGYAVFALLLSPLGEILLYRAVD